MSYPEIGKELAKKVFVSKNFFRCLFVAVIPALIFYSLSLTILGSLGFSTVEILRDPAQQSGASSFLGFLSNMGVWLWVSSTAICFFSCSTDVFQVSKKHKELIFLAGLLSMILAVDDFFLIHDLYVDQKICYSIYMVCAVTMLVRHYKMILEIDGLAFLLAGLLLALSIASDLAQYFMRDYYHGIQIIEEGFKFIGSAAWLYFIIRVASFRTANKTSNLPVTPDQ
jgi:hypothetical protein